MARCPAAGAGGGYVYKCTFEENHPGNHNPVAIPVSKSDGIPSVQKESEDA